MPIELDTPVTRPATAEKTYPLLWLYQLRTLAPDPLQTQPGVLNGEDATRVGRVVMEAVPMAADGELLWSEPIIADTDELYRMAAEVPEVATAFDSILASLKPAKAWIDARAAAIAAADTPAPPE